MGRWCRLMLFILHQVLVKFEIRSEFLLMLVAFMNAYYLENVNPHALKVLSISKKENLQ